MNYAGKFDAALTSDGQGFLDGQGFRSSASDHVDSFTAKSFTATAHGHVPDGAVVIADPNLIFHGDFKRAGLDLVLSRDGHDFVVHDYFRGDKRAAIASPDGAHLTGDIVSALTGYVQVAQAAPGAAVAQVIGHVTKLTGSATVVRNGVSVILNNGDNVEKGDVVSTGSDSTLGITFIDGTVFGLSSNARMVLNEMVYDPNGSNNSSLLSLVAGTITFVAGETAKHGDMKIDTPVATMGIRGTAVLTEINFVVPAGGGDPQPQANFQVLVEPNGTTGSYILFDKLTLLPIATVNQAGQMIQISGGNVSVTNALLSPDVQKLINDVFTLKFTDNNTNTKLTNNSTDSITQNGDIVLIKTDTGATATATFVNTVSTGGNLAQGGSDKGVDRIPGAPFASVLDANGNVVTAFVMPEHAHATGDRADVTGDAVPADIIIFKINFLDQNLGDRPTVSVDVDPSKFTYTDSGHHDVTPSLTALQKQDIAATQIRIAVVADGGNNNNGSATLTYSIADHAFDFLADGETLTLTYIVSVNNNFSVQPEIRQIPITITITGSNDKPVITTSVPTITFSGGTSVPGGPLTTNVPTTGTLTFTDVDLTDTHTVSVALTGASLPDGTTVPPGPLAAFQNAMSVAIASGLDSTGTGTGTINWSLADLPVYLADFIPKGEVLTLVYTVTVADEHNATSTQTITVTITGTDAPAVVWIATNLPSGGFWKDAANWETGTVPTSSDDVIVITDQLHGLTPSYPVTIDVAAFGKSLTMDDYDTTVHHTAPQVVNHGTLTLAGALTLNADARFTNATDGTVFVGGAIDVETITRPKSNVVVPNTAAINNAGTLTLEAGGVIDTLTTIVNSGTINLSGGTLTLDTGIANTGGTVKVGFGATLVANAVTIDGGTVNISGTLELDGINLIENGTLNNSGVVNVKGAAEFADETGFNNAGGVIEVFAHDTLTIDHGSHINNAGDVKVDANSKLTVNGATIDGGAITVVTEIPVLVNAESDGGGSTFTFIYSSTSGTVTNNGELDLTGDGVLSNGNLTNNGTLNVTGTGNALDGEQVANAGTIEVLAGALAIGPGSVVDNSSGNVIVDAALTLNGATLSGGTIKGDGSIDVTGASKIDKAATLTVATVTADAKLTLDGITVSGSVITDNSSIELDDTVKLEGGAKIQGGPVTNNGALEIAGPVTLLNDVVTNQGTVQVDGSQTLTLSNTEISGGAIDGTGTIDVTGASKIDGGATLSTSAVTAEAKLTLDGITVSGSVIADNSSIELDHTVKLQGGAKIQGGPVTNNGTLEISGAATLSNDVVTNNSTVKVDGGQTLTLSGTEISGGAINGTGTIDIVGASKIDGGATLSTSAVTVEAGTTLTLDTATVDGATISDKGSITIDGTVKLTGGAVIQGSSSVFAPTGGGPATAEFNWGQLGTPYTIVGSPRQIVATDGTGGTVSSAGGVFARLDQSSGWSGNFAPGTHLLWDDQNGPDITIKFATPVSSAGAQIQADYYGSFTAEIIAYDLGGNVIGTVTEGGVSNGNADGSAIFIDLISSSADIAMVKFVLTSATYSPNDFAIGPVEFAEGPSVGGSGPIVNNGKLEISGAATLLNDIVTNIGSVQVDGSQTLQLSGTEIIGGTVNGAGTIDVTGASKIDGGATLSTGAVIANAKLTLDGITVSSSVITDNAGLELDDVVKLEASAKIQGGPVTNNGTLEISGAATLLNDIVTNNDTVQVDDGQTLTLSGTEISGGTVNIYSGLSGGTINVTGDSTIDGNASLNKGAVTVASDITLKLDDVTVSASKITNGGTVKVDTGKKLTLADATLTGGALTIVGTLASSGTTTITDANISNLYLLESTLGGLLTLVATSSTPLITNDGGTIRANNAELDINTEAVTNTGTLAAINDGTLKLISTDVTNTDGAVSIESGSTLDLSTATIDGGTVTIAGTLESTGTSAISNADITNTGTITVTGGKLTIDPLVSHKIINSHLIQANGGELDISGELIVNTADLKAVGGGILKLTSLTVTNDGGTVTVDGTSKLYLSDIVAINGGQLSNSGHLFSVSNANSISAAVTNTGTIEVQAGSLNLSGGLTGVGQLVIDDKATLELAGADAQTVTFAGGADTLKLDHTSLGFTGTIAGQSSTGGTFTVTGDADIATSSGDALDFTASGGTSDSRADIEITPTGTLTGAASGVAVTQNGTGDISLTATGDITGLAAGDAISFTVNGDIAGVSGRGIYLVDDVTGAGNITINNVTGKASGTGANSEGILVQNFNAANAGDISITQLGGAAGGAFGIDATTQGDGDVGIDAGGDITGTSIYGIRARSYGTGDITVTTEAGSVVTSGSSGIVAVNRATSLDGGDDSTVTVNAHGAIHSGGTTNLGGNPPAGIQAGYAGSTNGSAANTGVSGTVVVNNYADITAGAGSGIDAYNYGNGDVTVNSFAGTSISVSGTKSYGIQASALSGGTGDIAVTLGTGVTISGATAYGIKAYSIDAGDITVTLATGDSITADSSGIVAVNYATAIDGDLHSAITVEAHGTIHSGTTPNNDGATPGGIIAGYKPGGNATFSGAVNGDVIVDSDATITADAGYGIQAFTWGAGNVTVSTGETSSITAAGTAIRASDHGGGDVSVTNEGSATGAVGLSALATGAGNITIVNDGHLTGTGATGISVTQNDDNATGATYITNHGYVVGADGHAAIYIQENTSDTGIATIDNTGTIGPVDATSVASTTYAIVETGGAIAINNSGHIDGNIWVASATFDNKAAGIWTVSGTSAFGTLSKIDNAGEIDLHDGALVSSADGLTFGITNSGKIESWGSASITGNITNTNTIEIHTDGTLSLFGSLSGSGSVTIDTGATLVVDAAVSQTITFGGTGAELDIHTTDFGGSIAGLAATDKIDLSSIDYGPGTSAVYLANDDASTGGTLTITDAAGNHISLTLTGADYSHAVFAGSDDGSHHTLITVNAADDAPKFTTDGATLTASFAELADTTGASTTYDPSPAATGSIAFTDVDLTDRPTVNVTHQDVTWLNSDHTALTLTPDQISALESALSLQLSGKNNGTVGWSYSIADSALDFLGQDQTATVVSTVTLDDGHKTDTTQITVTISGANDAPAIAAKAGDSAGADLSETNAGLGTNGTLTVSDPDATDHVTVARDHVSVYLDGTLQADGIDGLSNTDLLNYLTVQSGDILNGTATHAQFTWNFNSGSQAFDFLAAGHTLSLQYTIVPDDGHAPTGTGNGVVTINIAGSNDAPTLDNATLAAVSEDTAAPAGSSVGKLFAAGFHDVDDGASLKAVAITADHATAAQGVWQYEVAGGNQWIDVSGVSDTGALVLATDTLLRFVPAANYSGVPGSLDVHALDDTYVGGASGATPVLIDITSPAIGSSVSTLPATLNTEVTPVTDPPAFKALAVNYVADSLTGDSIDLTKWQVVLPSVPGTADDASVTPTANGVVLHDHGYLETTSGFTPTAATPLHVSLSFSLDDGIGPYVAVTDGTDGTTGAFGSPANGLSFMFGWGQGLIITNNATGANVNLTAGLSQGTVYDATITDDGSHQTVVIVDHGTGEAVGSYTSDFSDYAAGNLVTITNREANDSQHDATVSNVTISNAFEGEHGVPIALSGLTAVTDTDGSEHMSLDLSGFPDGATFSVGQPGTGAEAGHWLISSADIDSLGASPLTMTAPADYTGEFSLHVSGTVVDQATGLSGPLSDTNTFTSDVAVKVDGGGPVIDTDNFTVSHNGDLGTDTIKDLSVVDSDAGASTDTFTLTATTSPTPSTDTSSVHLPTTSGSLSAINLGLADGVTYSPGDPAPDQDQITLTVTDKTTGAHDTVNFIFDEAGDTSQGITLTGTSGKDVIFAPTTGDTLTGGGGQDQFVFAPGSAGFDGEGHPVADYAHTITDFIEGVDRIDLRQFSDVGSIHDLTIAQQSGDTLVTWQQQISAGEGSVTEHESLLLSKLTANLKASDFIFHIT
ncbi:hypothetical protein XH91_32165 [Bradyrhizobium guangzhouense]|uniref:FecR protein domain-containing protein n=1 Tax=Bradyrhizobium guangzhouense TaxID=1325095 RepID=A0AAE5X6A1_9BRAD|nr:hypothetical protein XH91_32165 [Bradyrhizobium guangzhouense]